MNIFKSLTPEPVICSFISATAFSAKRVTAFDYTRANNVLMVTIDRIDVALSIHKFNYFLQPLIADEMIAKG